MYRDRVRYIIFPVCGIKFFLYKKYHFVGVLLNIRVFDNVGILVFSHSQQQQTYCK